MSDPFVAIGGDAAGLSAASKATREAPDREVVVFEKGQWVSYAHCGMPYYVKGEVEDLTDLLSLRPSEVADRGIDLRRGHEVTAVDPDAGVVRGEGPDGRFEQPYGDLLVATGARARESPFDLSVTGAFTMHSMDGAAAMRAFLGDPATFDPEAVDEEYVDRGPVREYAALEPPETAAVVGGGYVGVEMAEALTARGVDVRLFQRPDRLLPPFGEAVGREVEDHLEARGVAVHTGVTVTDLVAEDGRIVAVECEASADGAGSDGGSEGAKVGGEGDGAGTDDGPTRHAADLAVVGIGVLPNVEPVEGVLDLGESGAIATDEYGRTSREGVYAAGDCAEAPHAVTGDPAWVPLGLTANRAGRAVGQTVTGDPTPVGEIAGTAVVKAFDLGAGRTGILDPDRAREAGFDPATETVTAGSRSGYYPGAEPTTVTLTADRESGRVLGAATVGADRAAKRVDTVATALDAGLTVAELERLDLGYAPPFSPVWDPVLVAAKVLGGAIDGD